MFAMLPRPYARTCFSICTMLSIGVLNNFPRHAMLNMLERSGNEPRIAHFHDNKDGAKEAIQCCKAEACWTSLLYRAVAQEVNKLLATSAAYEPPLGALPRGPRARPSPRPRRGPLPSPLGAPSPRGPFPRPPRKPEYCRCPRPRA